MKKLNKRGAMTINDVIPIAITLVVIAIVLGVGADVLDQVRATQCDTGYTFNTTSNNCHLNTNVSVQGGNSYAFNASSNGLSGIDELSGFQQTWGIVIALAVIIGILGFLYTKNM